MFTIESSCNILSENKIRDLLANMDVLPLIEKAFVLFSEGKIHIPPVTEMNFENPEGDVHIKCASSEDLPHYVVKIASGFYQNQGKGLSSSQGLVLLFDSHTGATKAVLMDNGFLTDVRTGIAGAVCAKYMAPKKISCIGIVGAGIQAKMQLHYLKQVTDCREVYVWARSKSRLEKFVNEADQDYWNIIPTENIQVLAENSNLIVSTTPSKEPLLRKEWIQAGTHITAVGSDTPYKVELDPVILKDADLVVVDSKEQSQFRGELYQMYQHGFSPKNKVAELGDIITGKAQGRINDNEISVADLTGIAAQDLMIAQGIYEAWLNKNSKI